MKKFLLILFIPLLLRFYVYKTFQNDSSLKNYLAGDSITHLEWAKAIRNAEFDRIYPLFRAPAYGIFLSLIPENKDLLNTARLIQHLLGIGTTILVFFTARLILPLNYACLAAFIYGIMPIPILMETQLFITSLYTFFTTMLCYSFLKFNANSIKNIYFLFFCNALSFITRPNIILFYLYSFGYSLKQNLSKTIVCFLLTATLFVLPFIAFNSLHAKSPAFISTQGPINLYAGNSTAADGLTPLCPILPNNFQSRLPVQLKFHDQVWFNDNIWLAELIIPNLDQPSPLTLKQRNSYWQKRTLKEIGENPAGFIKRLFFKCYSLFAIKEIPNNLDAEYFLINYLTLLGIIAMILPFSLLSALTFSGLIMLLINRKKHPAYEKLYHLFIYLTFSALLLILFFVNSRFRTPLIPVMSVLSVFSIYQFFQIDNPVFRKKVFSFFILLLIIFSLNKFTADTWQVKASKALFHNQLAKSHALYGKNLKRAIIESDNALNLNTNEKFIFLHTRAWITMDLEKDPVKALNFANESVKLKSIPENLKYKQKLENILKSKGS